LAVPGFGVRLVAGKPLRCITRDTLIQMASVTIRELRNHGGEVVDRAARGEQITITRSGRPVAELRRLGHEPLTAETLISRRKNAPSVDYEKMREELDAIVDPSL
jgi:antitoxin (DNA-binding transcriptional repressor) of toxin-antitoxin stability system